ncbi:hypothetical protein, partial [Treponema sp. R6D11]
MPKPGSMPIRTALVSNSVHCKCTFGVYATCVYSSGVFSSVVVSSDVVSSGIDISGIGIERDDSEVCGMFLS